MLQCITMQAFNVYTSSFFCSNALQCIANWQLCCWSNVCSSIGTQTLLIWTESKYSNYFQHCNDHIKILRTFLTATLPFKQVIASSTHGCKVSKGVQESLVTRVMLWPGCTSPMLGILREGFKKKMWKSMVFCQTGGGGVSEGGKKPNCFFETEFFSESI